MCISFSSLINNNNSINRTSPESISRHLSTDTLQQQRLSTSSIPIETTSSSLLLQSIPNVTPQQQVILVTVNQHPQRTANHESNNNLLPLSLNNISNSSSSINSIIPIARNNGQVKTQYECPTTMNLTSNNSLIW
jgi:hypothetical protein